VRLRAGPKVPSPLQDDDDKYVHIRCDTRIETCTKTRSSSTCAHICTYTYTYTYICIYTCIHIHIRAGESLPFINHQYEQGKRATWMQVYLPRVSVNIRLVCVCTCRTWFIHTCLFTSTILYLYVSCACVRVRVSVLCLFRMLPRHAKSCPEHKVSCLQGNLDACTRQDKTDMQSKDGYVGFV
jgi:hypothetical protein